MSTMSFLRNVRIKDKRKIAQLIRTLESAKNEPERRVEFSRPVVEVRGEDVKKIWDNIKV